MNKKYLLYIFVPVFALASFGAVYANSTSSTGNNPMDNLVNAIAEKFNLNASDVQQVFNDHKATMQAQHQANFAERQAEMQTKFTEKLAQLVSEGKLTQDQADKITAKRAELKAQGQNPQNAKVHMDELKQWAEDNNIPFEYMQLGGFGGMKMGHGFRGPASPASAE